MFGDESIRAVPVGHGREMQLAVGQVDTFVGHQLRPSRRRMGDSNVETVGSVRSTTSILPSSIHIRSPSRTSSNTATMSIRWSPGSRHDRRCRRRPAGRSLSGQHKQVAPCQANRRFDRDPHQTSSASAPSRSIWTKTAVEIAGPVDSVTPIRADGRYRSRAWTPGVPERETVADRDVLRNISGSSRLASAGVGGLRGACCREPDARRASHVAERRASVSP